MSATGTQVSPSSLKRRIRNGAFGLAALALAFYLGFIALLIYRSHH